jgi:hypothetical protein
VLGFADQAAYVVTGAHQMRCDRTADKTACARDENFQDVLLGGNTMTGKQYPPS